MIESKARSAQSREAKLAEIRFRHDLCRYRVDGEHLFEDEFDGEAILPVFRSRLADAVSDVSILPELPCINNCLEVGAECCQRVTGIQEYLGIPSWAADISLDSLRALDFYAPQLGLAGRPKRVCCDLACLPFRSGAFDLVIAYQTLHHFQRPAVIVAEIRRVNRRLLVNGDEPTRRLMRAFIGTQRHCIYSRSRRVRGRWRSFVEDTFLRAHSNELDYGVIENEELTIPAWRRCVEPWYTCEWYRGSSVAQGQRIERGWNRLRLLDSLIGTSVSLVGRVKCGTPAAVTVEQDFICPDCLDARLGEHTVRVEACHLRCSACQTAFPIIGGIPILLPTGLRCSLYPTLDPLLTR